jgi:hypothetical protein
MHQFERDVINEWTFKVMMYGKPFGFWSTAKSFALKCLDENLCPTLVAKFAISWELYDHDNIIAHYKSIELGEIE